MSYQLRTTTNDKREPLIWLMVVLIVGVGELVGLVQLTRGLGERLFNPLLRASTTVVQISTSPYWVALKAYNSARYIQDLEYRYSESLAQLSQLAALQQENQELRQLIEQQPNTQTKRVVSTPILSLTNPAVAGGLDQGLKSNSMVLIAGTLVGRITEVSEQQSTVTLLSHPDSVPVLAKTENGAQGLVIGNGRRVLLTEVPLDTPLEVGQRVTTLGQEGVHPNMLVGRVQSVLSAPSASVQTAVIEQLVSFHQAKIVEIY